MRNPTGTLTEMDTTSIGDGHRFQFGIDYGRGDVFNANVTASADARISETS